MNDELWTEKQVSEYLKIDENTIQGWRWAKKGPPYIKLPTGAVRYIPSEVMDWAVSRKE
jgi:predicted DNA-binding transcriptional regulator AlpA